jgi:hypothetical protein
MRTHDGRIGGAIAGVMLIGLPAIDLLWAIRGIALVAASAFGMRRD